MVSVWVRERERGTVMERQTDGTACNRQRNGVGKAEKEIG